MVENKNKNRLFSNNLKTDTVLFNEKKLNIMVGNQMTR